MKIHRILTHVFYIRSAAFAIVVTQKLVPQQSKNVTAKCTETLSPPPSIPFSLVLYMVSCLQLQYIIVSIVHSFQSTHTVHRSKFHLYEYAHNE